jgi:hypothetical protein
MIAYCAKFHHSTEHSLSKYYQSLNFDDSYDSFHFQNLTYNLQ